MKKKCRRSNFLLLLSIVFFSLSFSSCWDEPRYGSGNILGDYYVDGYIYPITNTGISFANYYDVILSIEPINSQKVYVSLYDRYDWFQPFEGMICYVDYDYREGAFYLTNSYYPRMSFWIYPGGYVYLDFPYITYQGRPCGYYFTNDYY